MTTPTRDEIREEALSLFFQDNPSATTPEDAELKESGYWTTARDSLMRGENAEYLAYLEQQAHDVGLRLVTEADHSKLIDLERKVDAVKTKTKKLKVLEAELASIKKDLDKQGKVKIVTVEKIVKELKWRNKEHRKQDFVEEVVKKAKKKKLEWYELALALEELETVDMTLKDIEDELDLPTLKLDI